MHFWIDKRSQCTYTGRHRVPSSLSAGRARGRVCAGVGPLGPAGRKGMAAPVHRFAAVDCPRRPHRAPRPNNPPARRADEQYVELGEPQPTIASLAAARSVTPDTLLRTAALGLHHHSPVMAPHLKFGMLVSFALATAFLTGAKYYFDRQVAAPAAMWVAVASACGVSCALAACRARPPPPAPPDRVSSTAQRDRQHRADRVPPEPSDDITLATLLPREEAPPPYKIAVLMPGPSPPPPAYSELS